MNESIVYGDDNPLDYDAWDGYQGNRNRTFKTLYDNNITNNILMSVSSSKLFSPNFLLLIFFIKKGDSHMSWCADLVWLGEKDYSPATGAGAIGVEFAGSAVSSPCPYGQNITMARANNYSAWLVANNDELQWQDVCKSTLLHQEEKVCI